MSLLGIDIGTTGCKAALFSEQGRLLAAAYREYDVRRPEPGWAELDALEVWAKAQTSIREAIAGSSSDPVEALSVSSLGEAMVPVTNQRQVLSSSLLNFDVRGEEYLASLNLDSEWLYRINGNTLGNHFSLPKLKWVQQHQRETYDRADKFLLWGSFVSHMLGAEPVVDYSLANRTLLFDLASMTWSEELLGLAGIDRSKLPNTAPSGTAIGTVSRDVADSLGLPHTTVLVNGAHDQCANAVGCGVIREGRAVYGMGTFICITPVFGRLPPATAMIALGLNTEHHAVPGLYVTFIFNQGGSLLKWFRDTFAAAEYRRAQAADDIFGQLISEMPERPSTIMALPHWAPTGPPEFVSNSSGVLAGLRLETSRGDILKGILEGTTFYLRECLDALPETGIEIAEFRAVGGGSRSNAWIQLTADIMGRSFLRPQITEAGALGAAIIAGVGCRRFASFEEGVAAMVKPGRTFEPDTRQHELYQARFAQYRELWPLMRKYLQALAQDA